MEDKRNYFEVAGYTIPKKYVGIGMIVVALIGAVLYIAGVLR
jgi:hypothetical protein